MISMKEKTHGAIRQMLGAWKVNALPELQQSSVALKHT